MRNKKRTVSSKGYDQHREGPTVLLSADDAEIAIEHFYSTTQRVRDAPNPSCSSEVSETKEQEG